MAYRVKAYTLREESTESSTRYFISFKDGQGKSHELEVSEQFFMEFRQMERRNRNLLQWDERHREFNEVWDETLYRRALRVPKSLDERMIDVGREVTERTYERHCFFTEQLIAAGVDPRTAEADACRIEHIISDESFSRLKEAAAMKELVRRQIQTVFALLSKKPSHRTAPIWQPVRKLSQCNRIPYFLRSSSFLLSGRFFIFPSLIRPCW